MIARRAGARRTPLAGAGSGRRAALAVVAVAASSLGCGQEFTGLSSFDDSCAAFRAQVVSGGPPKDGIPALTNPELVAPADPRAAYLRPDDRVIGVRVGAEVVAVPLNIGWWHEIVNIDLGGRALAVTHCPLTGSSMAFDRAAVDGAEFGVSGLLFQNNLIMYDRRANESLWPQMARQALCGEASSTVLPMYPVVEATWASWVETYPETRVVSSNTGFQRPYNRYPYGTYREPDSPELLFPMPIDPRRPPKELVLGIPAGAGIAFPFGELSELGEVAVVYVPQVLEAVLFWDARSQTAAAFSQRSEAGALSFEVRDGQIVDHQTGSVWSAAGRARSGPLAGTSLPPLADAYVAFWFAWVAFHPNTELWRAE